MKQFLLFALFYVLISCSQKNPEEISPIAAENKKIESLNIIRAKKNDSITLKNRSNSLPNLDGNHKLSFSTDEIPQFYGTINFENIGKDLYRVKGKAVQGKNTIKIEGNIKRISLKLLNFEGEIYQNINGASFTRKNKTTFSTEGKGQYWRLQNKINGLGFVDYLDIYY